MSSSNAKIVHSVFDANQSTAMGGAIYLFGGTLDVGNGRFYNNRSVHGGAVAQSVGATNLINCTISHNRALRGGGGAHVGGGVMNVLLSTVVCNRVSGPEGGGLNIYGGTLNVENSLLWDNVSGLPQLDRANVFRFNGTLNTTYTLLPDETLARTYSLADLVVDAAGPDGIPGTEDDDLRLKHGSLALNWGNAAMLPLDYMDLDGDGITDEPLPIDAMGTLACSASVDAGAFECSRSDNPRQPVRIFDADAQYLPVGRQRRRYHNDRRLLQLPDLLLRFNQHPVRVIASTRFRVTLVFRPFGDVRAISLMNAAARPNGWAAVAFVHD